MRIIIRLFVLLLAVSLVPVAMAQSRGSGPACPENLRATASEEGNLLEWDFSRPPGERDFAGRESEFRVYRAPGESVDETTIPAPRLDERFELIATLDADTIEEFLDTDVEAGEVFAYSVTFNDGVESDDCEVIEVTAIPFFGAPALVAVAATGTLGAYVWLGRRRKA